MKTKGMLALLAFAFMGAMLVPGSAVAQSVALPNKMQILVGVAAGGPNDAIARMLADRLREKFGITVVVVNQTAAARLWPGENAVGKRIKQGWPESETPWREVVGVAADLKLEGIDAATPMQIYLPFVQELMPNPALILRSSVDPATLSQPVREAVHRLAPSMPVYAVQTLQALMSQAAFDQDHTFMLVEIIGIG